MTPDRQLYAVKRVMRLNTKIVALDVQICAGIHTSTTLIMRDHLMKQRRSSIAARKRWLKEL